MPGDRAVEQLTVEFYAFYALGSGLSSRSQTDLRVFSE